MAIKDRLFPRNHSADGLRKQKEKGSDGHMEMAKEEEEKMEDMTCICWRKPRMKLLRVTPFSRDMPRRSPSLVQNVGRFCQRVSNGGEDDGAREREGGVGDRRREKEGEGGVHDTAATKLHHSLVSSREIIVA